LSPRDSYADDCGRALLKRGFPLSANRYAGHTKLMGSRNNTNAQMICPSCQSVAIGIVDRYLKSKAESAGLAPPEGRIAIVTDAGRDAVDARRASDEGIGLRTAKSCGPDASTLDGAV
jgi:hypothetical protein